MLMHKETNIVASLRDWEKSISKLEYDKISYLPTISSIEELIEVYWDAQSQSWKEFKYFA